LTPELPGGNAAVVRSVSVTLAFVYDQDAGSLANVDGDSNFVRVQVLTNSGALERQKQLAVVRQLKLADIIAAAAGDPPLPTGPGCC